MVNPDTIPRYAQPMDIEPTGPTCGECAYYREVRKRQQANGMVHSIGLCVCDVYQAKDADELATAEVYEADPDEEACDDWERML